MVNDTSTVDDADVPDSEDKTRVLATDLRVGAGGRVTIPDEKRERYGIEQGDYIDAVVFVADGAEGDDA